MLLASPLKAEHGERDAGRCGDDTFEGGVFLGRRKIHSPEAGLVQRRQQRSTCLRRRESLCSGDGGKGALYLGGKDSFFTFLADLGFCFCVDNVWNFLHP